MRFGIGSFAYRWSLGRPYYKIKKPMMVGQFLERAIFHKAEGIMLCNNLPMEKYSSKQLNEIRGKIEKQGMFLEIGARGGKAEDFFSMLEISHKLGSKLMRIVTDVNRDASLSAVKSQIRKTEKYLVRVLKKAKAMGIVLAMENYHGMRTEEIVGIVRNFEDPYLGTCVDTSNSAILMEDPYSVARALAPYAKALHLKDFRPETDPRGNRFAGTALGDGIVDFLEILRIMDRQGYTGNACLELYIDRKETEKETVAWEEACVKKSMEFARRRLGLLR